MDPAGVPSRQYDPGALCSRCSALTIQCILQLCPQLALNVYYKLYAFKNDVNINFLCITAFDTPKVIAFLLPIEIHAEGLRLQFQGDLRALTTSDFHPSLQLHYQIYLPFV